MTDRGLTTCTYVVFLIFMSFLAGAGERTPPSVPFEAWVAENRTYVHQEPRRRASILGGLSRGDTVRVLECLPTCVARNGFGRIEPFGYVRLSDLGDGARPENENELRPEASFRYVRTRQNTSTRAEPNAQSRVLAYHRGRDELALVQETRFDVPGWLRRAGGGWIAEANVRILTPSTLTGSHHPTLPLAFITTETNVMTSDDSGQILHRYDRFPVLEEDTENIRIELGLVPREAVRIASIYQRPSPVSVDDQWVHISLKEQTLTAYEGDTPVFTTLISTGTFDHPTRRGLFRVFQKTRSMEMNGADENDRYHVEAVPHVLFFHDDLALHGAYWHDRFGRAISHGCVNLSPSDARTVYEWAPPALPQGFRSVFPLRLDMPTLYVLVTR